MIGGLSASSRLYPNGARISNDLVGRALLATPVSHYYVLHPVKYEKSRNGV